MHCQRTTQANEKEHRSDNITYTQAGVAVAQHFKKNKLFKIIIKTNLFRSDFKEVVFLVVT
jgi:hypothetical protein